jgi:hypothetical protein
MPISDAKRKADNKYKSLRRKQIVINYSIDEYVAIQDFCRSINVPMATWVKGLIKAAMSDKE